MTPAFADAGWTAAAAFRALLLSMTLAAVGCSSMLFQPLREHAPQAELATVAREDWFVRTPDGVLLHGWILAPRQPAKGTLVFFHGNAENISTHVNAVLWLALQGYRIVAVDYRGYGRSHGSPDLDGVHIDALAVLEAVFRRPDVDPERVVVLGQSLGGAVAVYAVARSPHRDHIRLLVVDSAFAGYRRIARDKLAGFVLTWPLQYPLSYLLFGDRYDPERWIRRLSPVPVLILHGALDRIVPVAHARILYDAAQEPKGLWIVRDVGHIQALRNRELRDRLLATLEDLLSFKNEDARARGDSEGNP